MWSALRSCLSEYLDFSPRGMISSFAFWRRERRAETRGFRRNRSGGLEVGLLEPKLGKRFVRGDLFALRGLEQPDDAVLAELPGPGLERAVTGNLVMLYRLRRRDEAGVECDGALEVL